MKTIELERALREVFSGEGLPTNDSILIKGDDNSLTIRVFGMTVDDEEVVALTRRWEASVRITLDLLVKVDARDEREATAAAEEAVDDITFEAYNYGSLSDANVEVEIDGYGYGPEVRDVNLA
jgi:hypothetical protein